MPRISRDEQNKRLSSIFINAPYGPEYEGLFLAYLVGSVSLGLTPRAAMETYDTSASRLMRIAHLIQGCRYSVHDLSVVSVGTSSGVPRFNMPLELGMAVMEQNRTLGEDSHRWIVFDAITNRPDISISDLKGYEALNHDGFPEGILRELLGNLESTEPVTYPEMVQLLHDVRAALPDLYRETGSDHIFTPTMFKRTVSLAADLWS